MIFPNTHHNKDGDIVFEISHLSESQSEKNKRLLDKKTYKNWITVDPIENEIIKIECECYDFTVTKISQTPCKHLREVIALLSNYGITVSKTIQN